MKNSASLRQRSRRLLIVHLNVCFSCWVLQKIRLKNKLKTSSRPIVHQAARFWLRECRTSLFMIKTAWQVFKRKKNSFAIGLFGIACLISAIGAAKYLMFAEGRDTFHASRNSNVGCAKEPGNNRSVTPQRCNNAPRSSLILILFVA